MIPSALPVAITWKLLSFSRFWKVGMDGRTDDVCENSDHYLLWFCVGHEDQFYYRQKKGVINDPLGQSTVRPAVKIYFVALCLILKIGNELMNHKWKQMLATGETLGLVWPSGSLMKPVLLKISLFILGDQCADLYDSEEERILETHILPCTTISVTKEGFEEQNGMLVPILDIAKCPKGLINLSIFATWVQYYLWKNNIYDSIRLWLPFIAQNLYKIIFCYFYGKLIPILDIAKCLVKLTYQYHHIICHIGWIFKFCWCLSL